MEKRGRKPQSQIRQNLIELLYFVSPVTGYTAYKIYSKIFAPCSQRSIYYHLQKGVEYGEFYIASVQDTKGDYSWGTQTTHVY